ncbi:MAG: type IV pilus modification protein PilV [Rhodanobacteraceae bacterium]
MMLCKARRQPRGRQAGVGMLEVLIAVLIVSIGFLGMAALQAKALSTNNSSMARSMATVASYSILDAMRADSAAADSGTYNQTVTANACGAIGGGSLATVQLTQWCKQLGSSLGAVASTTGKINCGNTGICTVTITFDDSRAGKGGSATQTVATTAGL